MEAFTPQKRVGLLPFECVMPISGRFARIESIELCDVLDAFNSAPNVPLFVSLARLAVNCCSVDGTGRPGSEWACWAYEDVAPIMQFLHRYWYQSHGVSK